MSLFSNIVFLFFFSPTLSSLQNFLAQIQRGPGLKSNMVGLEALLNLDEEIEFHDYLASKLIAYLCSIFFLSLFFYI